MIQESVDFAKHGKAVENSRFAEYEKMMQEEEPKNLWPDFLQKDEGEQVKVFYPSDNILGRLFRKVNVEGQYKKILQKEFDYSFDLNYTLLPWVLTDPNQVDEYILRWLSDVYREIVGPMTFSTKQIMQDF